MKIPKTILKYFNPVWNKDNRKKILNTFKIKRDFKETLYGDLYIETKQYTKRICVYDKENPLFQEFNQIPLNSEDWYKNLTYPAKNYLRETCFKFKQEENARPHLFLTPRQERFLDNRIAELTELFINDEDYHCFLRKDMQLRDSAMKKFVMDRRPLYKPNILIKRVKIYAIENHKPWFNKRGNLLPKIIKGFLNGEAKLPMTKKEKIKRSIEYTYNTFKSLAYCNAEDFKLFITLTFADISEKDKHIENNERSKKYNEYDLKFTYVENPTDYEKCVEKLNSFFTRLRRETKNRNIDFKYLGVPEYQKNGNIHYHFLFSELPSDFFYEVPSWLDFDTNLNRRRYDEGLKLWVYGKSTSEEIFSKERVSTYISKYLLKSLKEIEETEYENRLFKRRFYASKNLKKPEIRYSLYQEAAGNDEIYVSSFEKTNLNPYNQIQTTLYQIKKLDNEKEIEIVDSEFEEDWL